MKMIAVMVAGSTIHVAHGMLVMEVVAVVATGFTRCTAVEEVAALDTGCSRFQAMEEVASVAEGSTRHITREMPATEKVSVVATDLTRFAAHKMLAIEKVAVVTAVEMRAMEEVAVFAAGSPVRGPRDAGHGGGCRHGH